MRSTSKFDELDLLTPDLLGYVLIVAALQSLSREEATFARATPYAIVSTILSLPLTFAFDPGHLFSLFTIVLDAVTVWYLCAGIMRVAEERGNRDLVNAAETRRKLNGVAALASLTVSSLRLVSADLAVMLLIPVVVLALISCLLVLLMRRASLEIV